MILDLLSLQGYKSKITRGLVGPIKINWRMILDLPSLQGHKSKITADPASP